MNVWRSLSWLLSHPLNRKRPLAALWRWLHWQLGTRLFPGVRTVAFVDDSVLCVVRGMTGATGNVYAGLHEFEDMSFVLHFLRPGECFVDVGANIGSYTVLAAAVCGAEVLAFEPGPQASAALQRNLAANAIEGRVQVDPRALAQNDGKRWFTRDDDTTNRFVDADAGVATWEVETTTLDAALRGRRPSLIKIDVEGAEADVIAGARKLLADAPPAALIIELSGARHAELQADLAALGYVGCAYRPFVRQLEARALPVEGGNLLLLRDIADAQRRVSSAPRRHIQGPGQWL